VNERIVQQVLENLISEIDYDIYKSYKFLNEANIGDEFPEIARWFVDEYERIEAGQ
jgi:hypothetical protein